MSKFYEALQMEAREKSAQPGFTSLMKGSCVQIRTHASCAVTGCALAAQKPEDMPRK